MATIVSPTTGNTVQGVSINDDRRVFNFGDRVAELAPEQSPFFTYLSKVAKKPTDDPVFKFLERRHQWQRRQVSLKGAKTSTAFTSGTEIDNCVKVDTDVDVYGRSGQTAGYASFLLEGQNIAMKDDGGTVRVFQITGTPDNTADTSTASELDLTPRFTATTSFPDNAVIEVIGSAFAEAADTPEGWKDEMYNREGYTQIFRTAIPLFSGTAMATKYRGIADEYKRTWSEKLMEHKVDIEKAMLFGVGYSDEASAAPKRNTWGIVPYTEANGTVHNLTYAGTKYDDFIDIMTTQYAPETGVMNNQLVMASRGIMSWLNKLGSGQGFLANTSGVSSYQMNITNVPGKFGHNLVKVETGYGTWHFIHQPFLRGPYADYAVGVDLRNVAYRPLVGNGNSRDTFITTNVQDRGVDGRRDEVLTEAGLEISLPETHFILKFA